MPINEAVSMEPVKEKLRNLREYMPDQPDEIYDFGAYLADELNLDLVPQGFKMAAELAICDLERGINGFTGQPIRSRLVGHPSVFYRLLRIEVPELAQAVCPEDFAKSVIDFQKQVDTRMCG